MIDQNFSSNDRKMAWVIGWSDEHRTCLDVDMVEDKLLYACMVKDDIWSTDMARDKA